MNISLRSCAAGGLLVLGCLQMAGDLAGNTTLKGLGAASHASPAPKVFTAHEGFETFSSRFLLHLETETLELTPATYAAIRGPYNRRNAYGAVISYGPVLAASPVTQSMFESASRYALCGKAPILRELGVDVVSLQAPVTVELIPRSNVDPKRWQLIHTVHCTPEVSS